MFNNFFKKKEPLLSEEQIAELQRIKNESYMNEARKIMTEKGKFEATNELGIKVAPKKPWDIK